MQISGQCYSGDASARESVGQNPFQECPVSFRVSRHLLKECGSRLRVYFLLHVSEMHSEALVSVR